MSAVEQLHEPAPDPADLPGPESDDDEPLPDDEVFHLLQCRRRRDALRYLRQHDGGPVRMRDLAEQVAAWEHETTVAGLSSKERQRVYIPLYQTHLPKLDEAGVIEYDQHRGRVAVGPRADELAPFLAVDATADSAADQAADSADRVDTAAATTATAATTTAAATAASALGRRSARYYLGALAASGVLLAGAALGVPPFAGLQWGVVAALTALLFAAVSVRDVAGGTAPVPDE